MLIGNQRGLVFSVGLTLRRFREVILRTVFNRRQESTVRGCHLSQANVRIGGIRPELPSLGP